MDLQHHQTIINGLDYHFVTGGRGPTIAFLHGFPDLWCSWRKLMTEFIEAGYQVLAPDWRGFGGSARGPSQQAATCVDLSGDLIAIMDSLGIAQAGIVAHDLGSEVGWAAAKMRPDRFTAIASISVPYVPRGPLSLTKALEAFAPSNFYFLQFAQTAGIEHELDADPEKFLRRLFHTNSGNARSPERLMETMSFGPNGLTGSLEEPDGRAEVLPPEDLAVYVQTFAQTGFGGALDTYRSIHRGWELMAVFADRTIDIPALYLGGELDLVLNLPGMRDLVADMGSLMPRAEPAVIFSDVGHFVHWERPAETAALFKDFFSRHHPSNRNA